MVAIDVFEGTIEALSFTLTSLVDEGDEIVVVGVYSPMTTQVMTPKEKAQQMMDWIVHSHQGDNVYK